MLTPEQLKAAKKMVKAYFRYHHFTTLPTYESHNNFITCLSCLEALSDSLMDDQEGLDTEGLWKWILGQINSLSDGDFETLYKVVRKEKDNAKQRNKK